MCLWIYRKVKWIVKMFLISVLNYLVTIQCPSIQWENAARNVLVSIMVYSCIRII